MLKRLIFVISLWWLSCLGMESGDTTSHLISGGAVGAYVEGTKSDDVIVTATAIEGDNIHLVLKNLDNIIIDD